MIRCVVSKEMIVTDRNAAEILTLVRSGFSIRWAGQRVVSGDGVRAVRRRRRAPNLTPQQVQEMVSLRKKGLAHRIIARRFKVSVSGARNAIVRATKGVSNGSK